jgi:hypothetical protein
MLGFREGTPDEPRARTAACFCLEAGADEDLIQGGSPRESAGPRWLGGHCFGRRAPVRPRGSRVPPDAGHLPEFHVTPFRTILGAISRSPIREFPRRYQAPVVRVRREPGPPGHEHGHNNELRSGNKHDPHLPGDPACRARVLAQARQEAPEASCTSRAACQTEGGPQPRPLMYPRSPFTRWPGFPISGPGIGDRRLRDDRPRCADSPGWQIPCAPFRRGGGRRRPDDSG